MLSVITIMAVAFLIIARSERVGVAGAANQTDSELAAVAALERAKAEIIGQIQSRSNFHVVPYTVSRSYINPLGFRSGISDPTNVSYVESSGAPLTPNNFRLNLANLFYDPRVPVFIKTNSAPNAPLDFRYFVDQNRNGRADTNGFVQVVDDLGRPVRDTNGLVKRYVQAEPEWIGLLEKPDFPHSRTNRFVSRFAYVILPAGRSLDINFIHNQVRNRQVAGGIPFSRNQGFGTYEINLAAFLRDLNTNIWTPATYSYIPVAGGVAFEDALALLRYRFNGGNYPLTFSAFFGNDPRKDLAFQRDGIDGFGDGPLMQGPGQLVPLADDDVTGLPWPGIDNLRSYSDVQQILDGTVTSPAFANRLSLALNGTSTYDQETFSRLTSQLGTFSDASEAHFIPPATGKINLNYDNVQTNASGVASATNFFSWSATNFFTTAGDRLLLDYFNQNFGNLNWPYGTNVLSTSFIPIAPTNYYSPAIHRLLQLAANMYDASTNSFYPSVFRPLFAASGNEFRIVGYVEDPNVNTVPAYNRVNVHGIPMVIGAKKGFPNFNEVSLGTTVQAMRKLELRRPNINSGTRPNETNQMFMLTVSNLFGVEAWNSYSSNTYPSGAYQGTLNLSVANAMTITLTNEDRLNLIVPVNLVAPLTNISAWAVKDFKIPMLTNVAFLSNAVYRSTANPPRFDGITNVFDRNAGFPTPDFRLVISNRLNYTLSDRDTGRIIDYVVLNDLVTDLDITRELIRPPGFSFEPPAVSRVWLTNRVGNAANVKTPTQGIINQMAIALGQVAISLVEWNSYSLQNAAGQDKQKAIDFFKGYVFGSNQLYFATNGLPIPTGLAYQAPFSPVRKLFQTTSWQVNDPLVHYMTADLKDRTNNTSIQVVRPTDRVNTNSNLGRLNDRYRPWGGHPNKQTSGDANAFYLGVKDPGVFTSDDWSFPTNKFPNVGWLGRVHRGTPWQTLYLKSEVAPMTAPRGLPNFGWLAQAGGARPIVAQSTHPTNDWRIFDMFTIAQHPNALRGALSVNQSEIASWSAVLSGVSVLSNNTSYALGISNVPPRFSDDFVDLFIEPSTRPLRQIVDGINQTRARRRTQVFEQTGDILSVPELTVRSPFLDQSSDLQRNYGLNDVAYERIPQQILSLLKLDEPRYVVYAYGQSLKPAPNSILTSGPSQFLGMSTNYQITGEVVYRAVVRAEGDAIGNPRATPPQPPRVRIQVESFNIVPPE